MSVSDISLPLFVSNFEKANGSAEGEIPLYLIVSKFNPTRFGSRKSFRVASHVPSPTFMVLDEYVLLPAGERLSWGAMSTTTTAMRRPVAADPQLEILIIVSIFRSVRSDSIEECE